MRHALWAFLLSGCALTPSWHLGETSEVIERREAAVSLAGGGGDGQNPNGKCCGAFGAKVRVGVGWRQEVGFHVASGFATNGAVAIAGSVSYKVAPHQLVAVLIDVGGANEWTQVTASNWSTFRSIGSTFNLIVTTPTLGRSPLRIFAAARFAWALPLDIDPYNSGAPTQTLGIPFGLTVEPTRSVRLVFEGGVSGAFSESRAGNGSITTNSGVFGWAAFTFTYIFRKR